MTIHVHEVAVDYYDNKYVLVDPDRNVAAFVYSTDFTETAQYLTDRGGWTVDYTVGPFICTYDELYTKHPEYFI